MFEYTFDLIVTIASYPLGFLALFLNKESAAELAAKIVYLIFPFYIAFGFGYLIYHIATRKRFYKAIAIILLIILTANFAGCAMDVEYQYLG